MSIHSEIVGAGLISQAAVLEYRALRREQPLILTREPTNPVDPCAVIAMTARLQPVGYIRRLHAALIAPQMDSGALWSAYVEAGASAMRHPCVFLWKPGSVSRMALQRDLEEAGLRPGVSPLSFAKGYLRVD